MILTLLGTLALAAPAGPSATRTPAEATPPKTFAVRADRIHLGDGTSLEEGVVLVENGVIRAVGRGVELPPGTAVIEHHGVLTAGMVAAHAYTGAAGELSDSTRAMLSGMHAKYTYDPDHPDFERAVAAGITTVLLTPEATNLAGGLTAAVKTHGDRVLSADEHLYLSLHTTALWGWREPTSWPGALEHLEKSLASGEGAFGDVAAGRLPVILEAWERHEVARALDFATRHRLAGALRGGSRAGELADRFAASRLSAIVGPFAPGEDERHVRSVLALADAGVPIAFAMDSPEASPEAMRFSAALCVRAGLDPIVAWQGLTRTAAAVAGVGDHVGRLERGYDADLVLWSASPLELSSKIVAVYVDGELAFGGEQ